MLPAGGFDDVGLERVDLMSEQDLMDLALVKIADWVADALDQGATEAAISGAVSAGKARYSRINQLRNQIEELKRKLVEAK
jgi:hypothetical protein